MLAGQSCGRELPLNCSGNGIEESANSQGQVALFPDTRQSGAVAE